MSEEKKRQRIGTYLHPGLIEILAAESQRRELALNELLTEYTCLALGLDAAQYAVPRRPPGRRPGEKKANAGKTKRKKP